MTKINSKNLESVFQKAISEAKSGISMAIACWRWAKENKFNHRWVKDAEEQISTVLGVPPHVFVKTCQVFGDGDLCRGSEIVSRLGVSRCASILTRFSPKNQKKLIDRFGQLSKVKATQFDQGVEKLSREISKSGKKLSEQRTPRDQVEQALRSENRNLKDENVRLKTENAKLKKQLVQIKSVCV